MTRTTRLSPLEALRVKQLLSDGWSQRRVARELGISQPAVSHHARGKVGKSAPWPIPRGAPKEPRMKRLVVAGDSIGEQEA
jgi:predicted transcriptional regulator